jgi:hypothetical protein
VALGLLPGLVRAAAIPNAYRQVSRAFAVPSGLLYAIALTESGRQRSNGRFQPWPWTLNVAGTPRFYPTRFAACHAVRALITDGRRNIDIGLMQLNWRWHHTQMIIPCRALSPGVNLRIAARLLSQRHQQSGNWWIATGRYHDPGRDYASIEAARAYRGRVLGYWQAFAHRSFADNAKRRLVWLTPATTPARLTWIADRTPLSNRLAWVRGQ